MINLLPPVTKRQLKAARANILLLRYTTLTAAAVAFLALGTLSIYFVMGSIKSNAENTVEENRSKISNFTSVKTAATEFRANLTTAKSILDKEIVYSDTVLSIAQIIPSGVILDNLSLDANSFGSPMVINARAINYDRAIALKVALEQSSIFSNVSFTTVSGGGSDSAYSYSVTLSATLNRGAA